MKGNRNRKIREGIVVSNKMSKTVVIAVERRAMDERFKKIMKQVRKLMAHDEKSECKVGDRVRVIETKPISKSKRWRVQKVLMKAAVLEADKLTSDSLKADVTV